MKTKNLHKGVFFLLLTLLTSSLTFSSGVEIKCTFQDVNWGSIVGTVYSCYPGEVTVSNNSIIIESVLGNHEIGKSNSDVKALSVWNEQSLQRIPRNIESFFPKLEVLRWYSGNLVSINADDLHFSELKMLILYNNKIVQLDSGLFQYTPKLSWISFWNNQITNVGLDLLANLNELTIADFVQNPCINFIAGSRQAIQELKQKLVNQCLPLASTTTMRTTTEDVCDVRCTINDEVGELKNILEEQKKANAEQSELIANSKERINFLEDLAEKSEKLAGKNEERFQELEKQIREILAQP